MRASFLCISLSPCLARIDHKMGSCSYLCFGVACMGWFVRLQGEEVKTRSHAQYGVFSALGAERAPVQFVKFTRSCWSSQIEREGAESMGGRGAPAQAVHIKLNPGFKGQGQFRSSCGSRYTSKPQGLRDNPRTCSHKHSNTHL